MELQEEALMGGRQALPAEVGAADTESANGYNEQEGSESHGGDACLGGARDADGSQRLAQLTYGFSAFWTASPDPHCPQVTPHSWSLHSFLPTLHFSLAGRDYLFRGQPPLLQVSSLCGDTN